MAYAAVQRCEVPPPVLFRIPAQFTALSGALQRVKRASMNRIPVALLRLTHQHSYDATLGVRDGNCGAASRC